MTTFTEVLHVLQASAVTSIARAESGTITIPSGKRGRVIDIAIYVFPTVETVVNAGGLVEIENDAIDWKPLSMVVGGSTCVTEGGGRVKPTHFPVDLKLPSPSTITVYFTPYDNQSQSISVAITWETGAKARPNRANHIKGTMVLKASALTQITVDAEHITKTIPELKGGRLLALDFICYPTLETVVNAGGKVKVWNSAEAYAPFTFIVGGITVVDAGGETSTLERHAVDKTLPSNSTLYGDYTPYDNQSQSLGLNALWRGREPR